MRYHPASARWHATPCSAAVMIEFIYERARAGGCAAVISCELAAPVDSEKGSVAAFRPGNPDCRLPWCPVAFPVAGHRLVGCTTGSAVRGRWRAAACLVCAGGVGIGGIAALAIEAGAALRRGARTGHRLGTRAAAARNHRRGSFEFNLALGLPQHRRRLLAAVFGTRLTRFHGPIAAHGRGCRP